MFVWKVVEASESGARAKSTSGLGDSAWSFLSFTYLAILHAQSSTSGFPMTICHHSLQSLALIPLYFAHESCSTPDNPR